MRRAVSLLTLVLALGVSLLSQSAELRVVTAGPTGEIRQLQDANEIRVIFSEPMVALGRVPANPSPPWIRIQPAMKGAFRWSGHDDPDLHSGSGSAAAARDELRRHGVGGRHGGVGPAASASRSSSRSRHRRCGWTSRAGCGGTGSSISPSS